MDDEKTFNDDGLEESAHDPVQASEPAEPADDVMKAGEESVHEEPADNAAPGEGETEQAGNSDANAVTAKPAPWKIATIAIACTAVVAGVGFALFNPSSQLETPSVQSVNSTTSGQPDSKSILSAQVENGIMDRYDITDAESLPADMTATGMATTYDVPDFNTEKYSDTQETGFILTANTPLSTISSDVDTASYANLRRIIEDGYYGINDIPQGAVRAEEMINYFSYDYPQPSGRDLFSVTSHIGRTPWNKDTMLLTLGFKSKDADLVTGGRNLVFLVDVSGSMEGHDKLDLVKEGLSHLIDNLTKDDTISIVTYSGAEKVLVDGANGSEHANIKRALDYMVADGATNGEAGLRMAYDAAEKHFIDGGVNRIIICSDGDFNVGMSSLSDIHSFVDEKKKTGVYLSVLGYGSGNYSDSAMETIADHGNGAYYYIDSIEESDKVLIDDMRKNLTPLADDVKMQVEFNPAEVKAYRMIGYDNRQLAAEDFRDDSVDAGDIGPDTAFTVAYELVLDGSEFQLPEIKETKYGNQAKGEKNGEWLTASIRYKPFGSDEHLEQEAAFGERDVESRENDDWSFIASVIETAMVLKDSQYKGTADIRMAEDTLRQLPSSYMDEDKKGFQDLVAHIRDLMENRSMPEDGSTVDLDQDIYLYGKDSE